MSQYGVCTVCCAERDEVQPLVSRYTDRATEPTSSENIYILTGQYP